MTERRKTDGQVTRTLFRSQRLVQEGGKWYFHTREGTLEGPYGDSVVAAQKLDAYIKLQESDHVPGIDLDLIPLARA